MIIIVLSYTLPILFIADIKTCEHLKESLVSGHSKMCPWPDNPCPGKKWKVFVVFEFWLITRYCKNLNLIRFL